MSLTSLTTAAGLPLLGPHLPTLVISTASFFAIQHVSHRLAPIWLGIKWDEFDKRTKKGWASHVVSMAHALIIIPLAAKALQSKILARDPVFGYDPLVGHVLALSSGYFIWDTIDSLLNSTIGFVIHGACCLAVYLFSFRPFLAGFGPSFLLWELSTPFLNLHWFMDKTGLATKYPTFYLLNALVFMLVFFLARIVFGGYQSIAFFTAMYENRSKIPIHLHVIYGVGNLALNGLNMLWFSKMFAKMIARLQGDDDKPISRSRQSGKGHTHGSKEEEKDPLLNKSDTGTDRDEGGLALPAAPPSPVATVPKEAF